MRMLECPRERCQKFLAMPKSALALMAASALGLIFAFVMQYGFHYEPCILCLWQRVPYVAVFVFAGLALIPSLRPYAHVLLGLCAIAFMIGAGLALFHTGVERHWWLGTSGCAITPLSGASVEDLRTQLLHTVVARCDEISWTLLGFSMANYNMALSLLLAAFGFGAARKARP
jgi:disulfide bond formation protein DsbB